MNRVDGILAGAIVLVGLVLVTWLGVLQHGEARYAAGYAVAAENGLEAKRRVEENARKMETNLRAQLLERDAYELRKEQEHASKLEAAQRRVRIGIDSLRCPAGPVPTGVAAGDRPAAGGSAPDGPELVPEAAADVLGTEQQLRDSCGDTNSSSNGSTSARR